MAKLTFTGDIAFSKYFTGLADKEDLLSPEILAFLRESDHVVANVEGPISSGEKKGADSAAPVHASDARTADFLARIGADLWNLSNNHVLDCSLSGFDDTAAQAARVSARTFGAGRSVDEARAPVILPEAGGIGIFSICYRKAYRADAEKEGTLFWYDDEIIAKTINEIKKTCRYCVLVAHCGEEFAPLAPTYVREPIAPFCGWARTWSWAIIPTYRRITRRWGRNTSSTRSATSSLTPTTSASRRIPIRACF